MPELGATELVIIAIIVMIIAIIVIAFRALLKAIRSGNEKRK